MITWREGQLSLQLLAEERIGARNKWMAEMEMAVENQAAEQVKQALGAE